VSDLPAQLGSWLSEQRGEPVEVRGLAMSSAGARRVNALFDAVAASGTQRLALTMIPYVAVQITDVRDEAAIRTLAEEAGVPVPHVHHVCTDESVLGGPFFISTAVEGETVPRRLLRLVHSKGIGELVATQLGDAIAHLHRVDPARAPAALVRPPGNAPVAAALEGLDVSIDALLDPSPTFAYGRRWLERNAPAEPPVMTVVHSDIRTGNIIVGEDGLRAILDWEGARVGDPMEDVAWPCTRMWRFREDERLVGGMGGLDSLREAYVAAGGSWDEERFRWWRVLGTIRWGLGLAGQARQHLDGSYPSIVMAGSGRRVPELEYDALLLMRP
jgi:aminoglycoside phosphotransferase (APT) family kinase protein